jgi:hypothetical protein
MVSFATKIRAARMLMEHRGLAEASVGQEPLLACANEWRSFVRLGDDFLGAVEKVADAAARASEAEDKQAARRANSDVGRALGEVSAVTAKAYRHFATGRDNLYEFAKLFDVPTRRPSVGKPVADIKMRTDEALRVDIKKGADGLSKGVREMLDLGVRTQKTFRDSAILVVQAKEDLPGDLAVLVVESGLDFRDSVSVNVFARTNGVMRRATELSRRSWELMMMESPDSDWTAPWAQDPELGGTEA